MRTPGQRSLHRDDTAVWERHEDERLGHADEAEWFGGLKVLELDAQLAAQLAATVPHRDAARMEALSVQHLGDVGHAIATGNAPEELVVLGGGIGVGVGP